MSASSGSSSHQAGPKLGNIDAQTSHTLIDLVGITDKKDRCNLRLCNKHLRDLVDDLVEEVPHYSIRCHLTDHQYSSYPQLQTLLSSNLKVKVKSLAVKSVAGRGDGWVKSEASFNAFFADFESFNRLECLEISDVRFTTGVLPALEALAENEAAFPQLHTLEIGNQYLYGIVANIAALPSSSSGLRDLLLGIKGVQHLRLRGPYYNFEEDIKLDAYIASAFSEPGCFQHLESLRLAFTALDAGAVTALGSAEFPSLTQLVFSGVTVGFPGGFPNWPADAKWTLGLKELVFDECRLSTEAIAHLANCQWASLGALTEVSNDYLDCDDILRKGMSGMLAFANASNFPNLQTIITCTGGRERHYLEGLAGLCNFPSLRSLKLELGYDMRSSDFFSNFTGEFPVLENLVLKEDFEEEAALQTENFLRWVESQAGKMPALKEFESHVCKSNLWGSGERNYEEVGRMWTNVINSLETPRRF